MSPEDKLIIALIAQTISIAEFDHNWPEYADEIEDDSVPIGTYRFRITKDIFIEGTHDMWRVGTIIEIDHTHPNTGLTLAEVTVV